jgi:hypothetical protein
MWPELEVCMTEVPTDMIFCAMEGKSFPEDQFESNPEWGRVHNKDGSLHTVMGDPIDDGEEWQLTRLGGA